MAGSLTYSRALRRLVRDYNGSNVIQLARHRQPDSSRRTVITFDQPSSWVGHGFHWPWKAGGPPPFDGGISVLTQPTIVAESVPVRGTVITSSGRLDLGRQWAKPLQYRRQTDRQSRTAAPGYRYPFVRGEPVVRKPASACSDHSGTNHSEDHPNQTIQYGHEGQAPKPLSLSVGTVYHRRK